MTTNLIEKQLGECPTKLMAMLAGCSDRHLRNLVKRGEIQQVKNGKYNAFDVLRYFREKSPDGLTAMQEATLAVNREKARKNKLANDTTDRYLIPSADVMEFAHAYAGLFIQTFEATRKTIGALLDLPTRRKLNEKFTAARQELAIELEDLRSRCTRVDEPGSH